MKHLYREKAPGNRHGKSRYRTYCGLSFPKMPDADGETCKRCLMLANRIPAVGVQTAQVQSTDTKLGEGAER